MSCRWGRGKTARGTGEVRNAWRVYAPAREKGARRLQRRLASARCALEVTRRRSAVGLEDDGTWSDGHARLQRAVECTMQ